MGWERRGGKKKAKKVCEEAKNKNKNKMRVQKIKMEKVKFHLDLQ